MCSKLSWRHCTVASHQSTKFIRPSTTHIDPQRPTATGIYHGLPIRDAPYRYNWWLSHLLHCRSGGQSHVFTLICPVWQPSGPTIGTDPSRSTFSSYCCKFSPMLSVVIQFPVFIIYHIFYHLTSRHVSIPRDCFTLNNALYTKTGYTRATLHPDICPSQHHYLRIALGDA